MTREKLQKLADDFCDASPLNYLGTSDGTDMSAESTKTDNYAKYNLAFLGAKPESYKTEDFGGLEGMRFFERPIFAIAQADNPGFQKIKLPEVVGEHHISPLEWMPNAKSVISFFLPHNHLVVEANKSDPILPAMEWLYSRVDGQRFLLAFGTEMKNALFEEGYDAVTPYSHDRFIMSVGGLPGAELIPPYSSNWSERHIAFVTGLGTFGLSTNFISKVGCAGRLISIVTDWETEPDEPDYSDWLGYCNRCGACVRKCPAEAHFSDRAGKDSSKCGKFMVKTCTQFAPRYGCGKCQTGIPCEYSPRPLA